jgi:hypothetical protein
LGRKVIEAGGDGLSLGQQPRRGCVVAGEVFGD